MTQQVERIDFSQIDWQNLLPRLGIDSHFIAHPKKRGPCPIEQSGSTRFRFHNEQGRGNWVCNCGGGDGVRLVALVHGITDAKAVLLIREHLQGVPAMCHAPKRVPTAVKTPAQRDKARSMLQQVWSESVPIATTPAMTYLCNRVRDIQSGWLSPALRFHPALMHYDDESGQKSQRPALVARVVDASCPEKAVTIHRTYITQEGQKAPVSPSQVKKVMTTTVDKLSGESIQVNTRHSATVIVAEGIENALAWVAATGNRYAVYAALNCHNLSRFCWPKETRYLLVAADNDAPNPRTGLRPGLHNALVLQERAQQAGLRVKVMLPPRQGVDFDDLWNAGEVSAFEFRAKENTPAPLAQAVC